MSTDYEILKNEAGFELSAIEGSGRFEIDLFTPEGFVFDETIMLAHGLAPEDLAEVAINMLQAALYNCGDPARFKRWLHVRVDEADTSSAHTPLDEVK